MTLAPRSINAIVVPTGAPAPAASPTFWSAIAANLDPASTQKPSNWNKVWLGSLYGRGINPSLKLPPGASTSLNSPGWSGESSSLILKPLALKPAGKLDKVPASSNCLRAAVAVLDKPPNMCIRPKP